jgi:glutamine kinase
MVKVELSSKAATLARLRSHVQNSRIEKPVYFTVREWNASQLEIVQGIQNQLNSKHLVVRSSAQDEDTQTASQAGKYHSELGVLRSQQDDIVAAINKVIESYDSSELDNEVLVQPQVENVSVSGVCFTRDLETGAPYYVINYDDLSGSTDSVTAGKTNELKTRIIFRQAQSQHDDFARLLKAVREIEELVGQDTLDIEFAITDEHQVVIFQVRPLVQVVAESNSDIPSDDEIAVYIDSIKRKVQKAIRPHVVEEQGDGYLGVMPDWNPAEIIGCRPRTLALSLYKVLVTDRTWAEQRYDYWYKDLRDVPLMVTFFGLPYIDVRASFNSFLPRELPSELSSKLVGFYLDKLCSLPDLHDKVEFDVVYSCFCFTLEKDILQLESHGFTTVEINKIKSALVRLTNNIIGRESNVMANDFQRIEELQVRFEKVSNSEWSEIDKIYWLLEDCKRYGTLPFAGAARCAFVAMQLLNSLVVSNVLSQDDYNSFLASLETVSKKLQYALWDYKSGNLSKEELLNEYGHLRPGTYDILSSRYDDDLERYFALNSINEPEGVEDFVLSPLQKQTIDRLLVDYGLETNCDDLFLFFREAIEGREYCKFVFSRNVSWALEEIARLGKRYGLSSDDLSYLDVRLLLNQYASLSHTKLETLLRDNISQNKAQYGFAQVLKLPQVIFSSDDIEEFCLTSGRPNFIGKQRVAGEAITLENTSVEFESRIICIPSADPGYDWIFSRKPLGLVTMYGGCNSHMAIRCAELGLPAVIGAGEQNYRLWSAAEFLEIDCSNQTVNVLRGRS